MPKMRGPMVTGGKKGGDTRICRPEVGRALTRVKVLARCCSHVSSWQALELDKEVHVQKEHPQES